MRVPILDEIPVTRRYVDSFKGYNHNRVISEDEFYDICCPNCDEEFCVDEETLLEGGIECPNCGEHLEFDIDCDCEDEECGCDCCHEEEDK